MVKSMFAAIAGLKTHQAKMDVIGNNIANVNTWGFKTRSANFADAVYQNSIQGSGGNNTTGNQGGMNTSQLGFGVNMSSISTDFTTGSWNPTGNGLHCMINGPSFFIVGKMPNMIDSTAVEIQNDQIKTQGLSLSRVGLFSVDNQGYLVDNQGNYIFGYRCTNSGAVDDKGTADVNESLGEFATGLQPLRIPSEAQVATLTGAIAGGNAATAAQGAGAIDDKSDELRYTLQSYTIGSDGTVVGVSQDGKPYTIGKIAVAVVENVNGLEQDQGYLYSVGDNAGRAIATNAGTDTVGKVLSGYLEMANVDLATEIASMITTQRGYQANSKIITVTDEMLAELVNMKR